MPIRTRITDIGSIQEFIDDGPTFVVQGNASISGSANTLFGETSIGDPGFEAGSIPYSSATFDAILKVNDFGGGRDAIAIFHRHSTIDAANVVFTRSNTNDETHASVTNGQDLALLIFAGHDGTDYKPAASIQVAVDAAPVQDASMPGRIEFHTTPTGSVASTERWRIDNTGDLISQNGSAVVFPSFTDLTRPTPGIAGRVIFNTDDGQLNVDNGTNWTLPDGTMT